MAQIDHSSLPWNKPTYRDRHGRGQRRPLFGAWLPRYRTPSGMFDRIAQAEVQRLAHAWPDLFQSIQCTVEDVPPTDPLPWEDQFVLRSRAFPAQHHQPARITIYRRPLQMISADPTDLQILIREELITRLSELTGLNPEDIDPSYGQE